jgi:hypothetical protein
MAESERKLELKFNKKTGKFTTKGGTQRSAKLTDKELLEWIKDNSEVIPETGCWLWKKSVNEDSPQPTASFNGEMIRVFLKSWELHNGKKFPKELIPGHIEHCEYNSPDHRLCVAPTHVRPMTMKENNQIMVNNPKRKFKPSTPIDQQYLGGYRNNEGKWTYRTDEEKYNLILTDRRLTEIVPNSAFDKPCLKWLKALDKGYGHISVPSNWRGKKKKGTISGIKFMIIVRDNLEYWSHRKDVVRHKCENSWCMEPSHLKLGDSSENQVDARDGKTPPKGQIFNREQVVELLKEYKNENIKKGDGSLTFWVLSKALEYGAHENTIWSIIYGRTWKDIHKEIIGNTQEIKSFKRLTKKECFKIYDEIKEIDLTKFGKTKEVATKIAKRMGRSTESIVYVITGRTFSKYYKEYFPEGKAVYTRKKNYRLTIKQVREILTEAEYEDFNIPNAIHEFYYEMSLEYKVSVETIRDILNGRTHKDVWAELYPEDEYYIRYNRKIING